MKTVKSQKFYKTACRFLVGGVNSPVRAFKSVGRNPLFISKAHGAHLWDVDGNCYIDFVGSWGPMILGHSHPAVTRQVKKQLSHGSSYGAPTELETELAKLICSLVPSIKKVRFVSSGTEAVMTAIRLARAFTNREKIVKFAGCYHGHLDALLVKAGSGATTLGIPDSAGIPDAFTKNTVLLPYNNLEAVHHCFNRFGEEIASVIVEPVAGNMGVVLPQTGFLEGLRKITKQYKALLIFDEVITGFRLSLGGAQELLKVIPDLTCLGKIVGGGFPIGAVGGRKEVMELLAPLGPVYQAGTLSGNPIAMTAGLATIQELKKNPPYKILEKRTANLAHFLWCHAQQLAIPIQINHISSLFCLFFSKHPVTNYDTAKFSDTKKFAKFFHSLLEEGIYFPPSQFESCFLSTAHTETVVEEAGYAIVRALKKIV